MLQSAPDSFVQKEVQVGDIFFLLIGMILVAGAFVVGIIYNADKLEFGVPWLRWITFDEIVALGHSGFWTRIILPVFYRMNKVEIRISDQISEADRSQAEVKGLDFDTVEFYEYRFTQRWRHGKKKPKPKRLPEFQLLPV